MRAGAKILAIESSCDETACAVVEGLQVRASVVATQVAIHAVYGGVVPELASRHHLTAAVPVLRAALDASGLQLHELDGLAVTEGPGLVGALLVGVQLAQGLALATGLPLYGIHHMEGHLLSPFLGDHELTPRQFGPHLALSVSGGHSELVLVAGLGRYEVLGSTRDDAAGEAFDKVAKLLGLGYPGGPVIDRLAREGDPRAIEFPRAMLDRKGFESVTYVISAGSLADVDATFTVSISEGDVSNLSDAAAPATADLLGTTALASFTFSDDDKVFKLGYIGSKRYTRITITPANNASAAVIVVPIPWCIGSLAAASRIAVLTRVTASSSSSNDAAGSQSAGRSAGVTSPGRNIRRNSVGWARANAT